MGRAQLDAEELAGRAGPTIACGGRSVVLRQPATGCVAGAAGGSSPYGTALTDATSPSPGRSRTFVVSPSCGVVTLPGGVTGRCDVVVPDGPDGAVLLTAAGRNRGWPTVLEHSTATGWRGSRARMPTIRHRVPPGPDRQTTTSPRASVVTGGRRGYAVRIVERDGAWVVRRIF